MEAVVIVSVLLVVGYLVGSARERKHYQSILKRESELQNILVFESKYRDKEPAEGGHLVQGSVVISADYFKIFVAGLRKLVGGRLRSFESLLDRGRREAVLRMKEDAKTLGANRIFNVRFETSSVSKGADGALGSVEVLVYGSAVTAR